MSKLSKTKQPIPTLYKCWTFKCWFCYVKKNNQCSISLDNPVVKDQATYRYIMSMLCFCLNFLRLITKWKISTFLLLSRSESLIGHKVINRLGKGKSKIYFSGKPQRTNRLANSADLAFVLLNIQCKKTNAYFYHAG